MLIPIFQIIVNHEGQDFPVLVVRFEGRLYATGAYDTYDDKSRLIDGKCHLWFAS